jgi:sulfatase maturation enzyme AslB (radical SAM superfamily)
MRATERFSRTTLSESAIKRLIDQAAKNGISLLSFTGGEPLLHLDLLVRLIKHADSAGIRYIRTGTNGFFLSRPYDNDFYKRVNTVVDALAATQLRNFWISIDSCNPAVHDRMRGFSNVLIGIERALPVFHTAGLYPAANMGINRNIAGNKSLTFHDANSFTESKNHADKIFSEVFRFVTNLGFTTMNMCYPMSTSGLLSANETDKAQPMQPIYAATSRNYIVSFTKQEKTALFSGLSSAIESHRSSLRIFTPRSALHAIGNALVDQEYRSYPCRGGRDFYFASVDGDVYPCGYRGNEPFGNQWGNPNSITKNADCFKCEWECFRDPSELFGPITDLIHSPWLLARRCLKDADFMKLWLTDVRYFMACGFFNGRVPPDYSAIAKFAK